MTTSDQGLANRRNWAFLVVIVLVLYVIVPQLSSFRSSWHLLRHPHFGWAIAGLLSISLTYLAAAATYCLLAFKKLRYRRTLLMQLAAMCINRLLPSGLGGLGANFVYLRHEKHNAAQATTVVAVNNMLGLAGHSLIIAVTLLLFPDDLHKFHWHSVSHTGLWLGLIIVAAAGLLIWARDKFIRLIESLSSQLLEYRHRFGRLSLALGSSIGLTLANIFGLLACCLALGVHLHFVSVLIIFTAGIGAATALPTPGGIGGFEAGLTASLIAYNVNSSAALAIALLFRLISYWLPLLPGGISLIICQRRGLFSQA